MFINGVQLVFPTDKYNRSTYQAEYIDTQFGMEQEKITPQMNEILSIHVYLYHDQPDHYT